MTEERRVDIIGCARCDSDGHKGLTFKPFTRPVERTGATPFTFWAMCPTLNEPILMSIEDAP